MEIPVYHGLNSETMTTFLSFKRSHLVTEAFMNAEHQTFLGNAEQLQQWSSPVSIINCGMTGHKMKFFLYASRS